MPEQVKKVGMAELSLTIAELLKIGRSVKLTVIGNSMLPMLRDGIDSVVLKAPDELKKYDIPLYVRKNGEFVLHRIVKEYEAGFAMCGDNQTQLEYPIAREQIIAVASGFYRRGKYISCDSFLYKCYSFMWTNFKCLRPFAVGIIKIRRRIKL